jgi:hypothetical protein
MKKNYLVLGALFGTACAMAQAPVSGTISINRPGVYGRIDIGQYPQPQVVYAQPVLIAPQPVRVYQAPVYLYVPPDHAKDWRKHCSHYNACGQPVYFVQEQWVRKRYEAEHDHQHGHGHERDEDRHDDDHRGHGHGGDRDD